MATNLATMTMQTEPSAALGAEARPATDSELVETHMRRVFRLIYRVVGNVPDAQDLTQEALIKALRRRDQLKDPESRALDRPHRHQHRARLRAFAQTRRVRRDREGP
ncbi:MAG: sigma factor [Bryobacterales bacterium]